MRMLREDWSVESLGTDGRWTLVSGGPEEESARTVARILWSRSSVRGVRIRLSTTTVIQEKTR